MNTFKNILIVMILSSSVFADLKIVTTTTDFADLAKQIGGEKVSVHSVMKGPENPHHVLAKPTEMLKLHDADLFVHSGLDAEPWRENLLRGGRNPRVNIGQPGNVDMSAGIVLKDVPSGKVDRAAGDMHAFGNPHYTLNPQIAQQMTATLARAMAENDPQNAELYRTNAKALVNVFADIAREMRTKFAPYSGLKVVTFHKSWDYFADAIDITIVGTIEPQVSITPSPSQVQKIVQLMKSQDVRVVICETYDDSKLAQFVADQAGAKMVVLPDHVLGVPEADTYQKLFRYDLDKLIDTAKAAGIEPKPGSHADAR